MSSEDILLLAGILFSIGVGMLAFHYIRAMTRREEFIQHIAQCLPADYVLHVTEGYSEKDAPVALRAEANRLLNVYLAGEDIKFGDPGYEWSRMAAYELVQEAFRE